jgi:two-component system chemotaxis response regulator CheB
VAYKVLVVDDSSFFQMRLKEIINQCPDLEVCGIASNGQEAIDLEDKLRPDVISMDYEMPMMDGITAIRSIMTKRPVPIVMFSSMTYEGARITLDALEAGAVDFIPKNFAEVSNDSVILKKKLHDKLLTFARKATPISAKSEGASSLLRPAAPGFIKAKPVQSARRESNSVKSIKGKVDILLIGASTGGPVAVTDIIKQLPADFPAPVVIVQHMPENFTRAFAERLDRQSQLSAKEAEPGDRLKAGMVYVAPGGKQLMFDKRDKSIKIIPGDDRVNYKPCVDISFGSAASVYGGRVLAVVLTGMGQDGCEGARMLKQQGATIWAQNKESCVVYGMPAAVVNAGLADSVFAADEFAKQLIDGV